MLKYLMVGMGGFVGSVARFGLAGYLGEKMGTRFPYGTFVVNISGSFLIGLILTVLTTKAHLSPNWGYLAAIGFIGAYTTFSTFEYETLRTEQDGQFLTASLNIALSVVLGFIAVWAGTLAGKAIP